MKPGTPFACLKCGTIMKMGSTRCNNCGKELVIGGETRVISYAIPLKTHSVNTSENEEIISYRNGPKLKQFDPEPVVEVD